MREYMMDFIETFTNKEIAQAIRERILTISDVEVALRCKMQRAERKEMDQKRRENV